MESRLIEPKLIDSLTEKAKAIRRNIVRMVTEAGSGHPGGSLSAVEILTVLYFYKMRHDPSNPLWEDRDRFVLSKGHGVPVLFATLAEAGYFPVSELSTFRRLNSRLQGHADSVRAPFVDASTGALGQGLSISNGFALAARLLGKSYRAYVLLGDGETQEGEIWEAAMTAAHYKLDNVTAILDRNGLQQNGPTEKLKSVEPLVEKWQAFGWHTIVIDGNNVGEVIKALDEAERTKNQPTIIIAHTVKGKGVSFIEWVTSYHGKAPKPKEAQEALLEIGE